MGLVQATKPLAVRAEPCSWHWKVMSSSVSAEVKEKPTELEATIRLGMVVIVTGGPSVSTVTCACVLLSFEGIKAACMGRPWSVQLKGPAAARRRPHISSRYPARAVACAIAPRDMVAVGCC